MNVCVPHQLRLAQVYPWFLLDDGLLPEETVTPHLHVGVTAMPPASAPPAMVAGDHPCDAADVQGSPGTAPAVAGAMSGLHPRLY